MGNIRLLSEALASQVAAGEVVERPASVVKELVENSIDAGATAIDVNVARGGIALIQVTDNGSGMDRDDALMCLERNATSKIRTKEDLGAIATLGFRGEAIPSIASVSKFRLATRTADAIAGTEVVMHGGKMISVADSGEAVGTSIEVRSLFYNLPARRKFLRTESTEASHLEQVVRTQAIAHEEIRFTLTSGDRLVFQLPATSSLRERIGALVGNDLAGRLLEVEPNEHRGVRVRGFIGPPGMGRSDRRQQLTFLNGRPVEAAIITRALREGYHTALMKGQYPVTFLFLEVDPSAVDVNVHPAKREVRFHDGFAVQEALAATLARTLRERMIRPVAGVGWTGIQTMPSSIVQEEFPALNPTPSITRTGDTAPAPVLFTTAERLRAATQPATHLSSEASVKGEQGIVTDPTLLGSSSHPVSEVAPPVSAAPPQASDYRLIGVLGKLYVLLESSEGLVLMDQHAAHERVLFEDMRRRLEAGGLPAQRLLVPLTVELSPRDLDIATRHLEVLAKFGIVAEPFGGQTLKIDAVPPFLKSDDPESFFHGVLDEIRTADDRSSALRLGEDIIATTVCRHAVKANDRLRERELEKLLVDLLACDMPYCCPHGRPTLIQIGYGELERKFGRRT